MSSNPIPLVLKFVFSTKCYQPNFNGIQVVEMKTNGWQRLKKNSPHKRKLIVVKFSQLCTSNRIGNTKTLGKCYLLTWFQWLMAYSQFLWNRIQNDKKRREGRQNSFCIWHISNIKSSFGLSKRT